ncbi:MAG: hypothetical protein ACOYB7_12550 [Mycobacterium sp.]|jgi:hypothetical protein
MKKPAFAIGALVAVAVALGIFFFLRAGHGGQDSRQSATDNLAVTIGEQSFTLVNGAAEKEIAPGSKETVRVVGEPVTGDVTGDGKPDTALLIADDPGGSGTFYYAVLAVDQGGSWRATNALPLGDRIKPENIQYADGQFVYRFLERKPDEPMSAPPTVENTVPVRLDAASGKISAWG